MTQYATQYAFKRMLMSLPKSEYPSRFEAFREALGVSRETLYRYMNATWDSPITIPTNRLLAAARFWDCPVDDLINAPQTIEP